MARKCDIGVAGLAVISANLARNIAKHGFSVAVHNRHQDETNSLIDNFGKEGEFVACEDLKDLVAALQKPRSIVVMVKAGEASTPSSTDLYRWSTLTTSSSMPAIRFFMDTDRRFEAVEKKGIRYLGMGVSG